MLATEELCEPIGQDSALNNTQKFISYIIKQNLICELSGEVTSPVNEKTETLWSCVPPPNKNY